jgi:hypothetical protein
MPPGLDVAVYRITGAPPLDPGAENTIVAVVPDAATVPIPGAPGTVTGAAAIGVTGADTAETAEVPPVFVAVALNVYERPLVRPVTSQDPAAPVTVHVPAGDAVTAYDAGAPPVSAAATVTLTPPSPAVNVVMLGASGATAVESGDVYEHPLAVVPLTLKMLFAPFVRPFTWMDPLGDDELSVANSPVFAVAVNVVHGDVYVGAVKATVRVVPPAAAVTVQESLAASHPEPATSPRMTVTGVAAADAAEVPAVFVAVALTVYVRPTIRAVTSQDPDAPVTVQFPAATGTPMATAYAVTV